MNNISDNVQGVIRYRLDHADHVIAVDAAWLDFARQNGAAGLTRECVENQEIWRFISDPDTRVIYRLLFDAVRTRTRTLTVTYRCDSPTHRRFMQLTCSPAPRLGIDICSKMLKEESRPYVSTLDTTVEHSEIVVKLCAWCMKCQISEDDWRELEDALPLIRAFDEQRPPIVSHGMCPECHFTKLRQIRDGLHKLKDVEENRLTEVTPPG